MKWIVRAMLCFSVGFPRYAFSQGGQLDVEFGGGDGLVATTIFQDLPCQAYSVTERDGRIFITGRTRTPAGVDQAVLCCYLPDGTLDSGFNGNGKIILETSGLHATGRTVRVQNDGRIVLVTRVETDNTSEIRVYRFLADGNPDNSFDDDGVAIITLDARYISTQALILLPDGRMMIGGYIGEAEENYDQFLLIRLLPNGIKDESFGDEGIVITTVGDGYTNVASILVQPDGKIIAAGYAQLNQKDVFAAVRYMESGALDHSFGTAGISLASMSDGDNRGMGAALQPDGRIVIGGSAFSPVTGKDVFAAIRLLSNGSLDPDFHGDGMNSIIVSGHADGVRSMLLQPDGKIVLGGYAHSNTPGGADMTLVRLLPNGLPDPSFDGDGVAVYEDDLETSSEMHSIAIQEDGKIVGAGFVRKDGINSIRVNRIISGITVSTLPVEATSLEARVYPVPANDFFHLSYTLEAPESVTITLYDITGRRIGVPQSATRRVAGKYNETFPLIGLTSGNYVLTLSTETAYTSIPLYVN